MLADIRYALRSLQRTPGFAFIALLTLALGAGASSAIFSLVWASLLSPLPFRDPDRLVLLRERIPQLTAEPIPFSIADIPQFQKRLHTIEDLGGVVNVEKDLTGFNAPQRVTGSRASASLFPILGIAPMLGRTFTPAEDRPGQQLVVLNWRLWNRLGADREIVGRGIVLDRRRYTVIGVMPRGFDFTLPGMKFIRPAEFWIPMGYTKEELAAVGDNFNVTVLARLKPAVTHQQVAADVSSTANSVMMDTYPAFARTDFKLDARAIPLREDVVRGSRTLVTILFGAVGFLVLIACANVASLVLGRASGRHRELAIRCALGAGRARLVRQMLAETLILSLGGSVVGVAMAIWGLDAFVALAGSSLPRAGGATVNLPVLAFTLAVACLTGLATGVLPALMSSRHALADSLRETRSTMNRQRTRVRSAFVISQVALSVVLLTGAGLLLRSFWEARHTHPGFESRQVLTFRLALPPTQYKGAPQVRAFYTSLMDKLASIPGVEHVGAGTDLPISGSNWRRFFTTEGDTRHTKPPLNAHTMVLGRYFEALGIPLHQGRWFDLSVDRRGSTSSVIVNQTLARQYMEGRAVGRRIKWGPPQSEAPWQNVIGVAGDIKEEGLDHVALPHTYESFLQADDDAIASELGRDLSIAVRATGDPQGLAASVRTQVWSLDRELPVRRLKTMEQVVEESLDPRRFETFVVGGFAALALLLAALGLYGVLAYSVAQRTREIGTRMALGANRRDILIQVLTHGLGLAGIGAAAGLAGAAGITRSLTSLLYGVHPLDPWTFAAVALFLMCIAGLASYLPAARAMRVDPAVALRSE